ncbi:tRNA (guanosine(37)-N1)-methyltransferase TrmD [Candidatus Uhrbacteria bacterium RIFOXYB2_FULL_45_11]|uniref:tRNA (guanine-N(1)-)-methyltransferase n=1 Tax=Candidatus Uhrbacteria bacterium RIFOXYB2_FULL_45_11 TaxID=1802421 RepID=A0A1F7W3G0_9BACT|nr:MAG: tRNA (guanosine(37)-N1)-methyltransferase TrmD [Candidatus Uhrbacteria bacterium RIFOXYB2_FULL_45_11]
MIQFDILTIFPKMIDSYANESILGRAQKAKLIKVNSHDLRTYTADKHHKVDDTPYGGGPGMIMKVEPFDLALKKIKKGKKTCVILTAANGKTFSQADARRLAKFTQVIFLCGRYEGIDARVEEHLVDETFSIGNYVLTGGELPALVMTDAIARNIPGVLGAEASLNKESHTEEGYLEYPQYTKPEVYVKKGLLKKKQAWSVPEILLSGDHKKIEAWREEQSKKKTTRR